MTASSAPPFVSTVHATAEDRCDTITTSETIQGITAVLITTAPEALSCFLAAQIRRMVSLGYDVHTISSPGLEQVSRPGDIRGSHHEIRMQRTMSPLRDIVALGTMWKLLRRIRPAVVQTHTPKAGLLGMIAAWAARVPVRIYTINGLPGRVERRFVALTLALTERLACRLATEVLCVSRSVRRAVIGAGVCSSGKCTVLGDGGSHGVDIKRFDPHRRNSADRTAVRERYGIPEDAVIVAYVGRIVPAKGINELAAAWSSLRNTEPKLHLMMCGYLEPEHPLPAESCASLRSDPRVHFTDTRVSDMPSIYAAIDICVLPTWCEGLPNVVLEAAAMGVPVVATRVPGCIDAIRDGVTGVLVRMRDPVALARGIESLVRNAELRALMGRNARDYVCRRFSEERVIDLLLRRYRLLVQPDLHSATPTNAIL